MRRTGNPPQSGSGQKLRFRAAQRPCVIVRSTPVSRPSKGGPAWLLSAKSGCEQSQQGSPLFDDLVGGREQRRRHCKTERSSGSQIQDQFKPCRLLDRQIGRLLALEDTADIASNLAVRLGMGDAIARQAAGSDELAPRKDGGNRVAARERRDLLIPG